MEAQFGGSGQVYGPMVTDLNSSGKRTLEWDLNDWNWDGNLLVATSRNSSLPSDCRAGGRQFLPVQVEPPLNNAAATGSNTSSSCSDETVLADDNRQQLDKRRRPGVVALDDDPMVQDESGLLKLKLGGQSYPVSVSPAADGEADGWEGRSGKKTKLNGNGSNRAACQVENCGADLSAAKDYHRRHKVCEVHSKATQAIVGNILQRFCQQCSRFHVLDEFDEGKRSCRRRLAGHNRRRRKTHPETPVNPEPPNNQQNSGFLLLSLLRVLSNLHSSNSDQAKDQDLLSHLLRSLANVSGAIDGNNLSGLPQGSQALLNGITSIGPAEKAPSRTNVPCGTSPPSIGVSTGNSPSAFLQAPAANPSSVPVTCDPSIARASLQEAALKQNKSINFDLNSVSDDPQDHAHAEMPFWAQKESLKSSPPQTSRNSDTASGRSQSSSSGSDSQSRTDCIVFKLFGKDPSNLPHFLRTRILDWLSQSPTEIEGYIKPGCIVLTIYLRLDKSVWEELGCQLNSHLRRLLDMSDDPFWTTGWICTKIQHRMAIIYDGGVVLNTPLRSGNYKGCQISSISPIAVSPSKMVQFVVRGTNLSRSTSRLFCALEGKYLIQESCSQLIDGDDPSVEHDESQRLSFTCSIPDVAGRGFVEVEDYGMNGSFFPFIISDSDVCSEIRTLETVFEATDEPSSDTQGESYEVGGRTQALDFIHEMGWLLHRTQQQSRANQVDSFPLERFKWLLDFSMGHDWCAVVKKLLDMFFYGIVDAGDYPSVECAILEMRLVHDAVRRNSKPMVHYLLRYTRESALQKGDSEQKQVEGSGASKVYLFRPDAVGPGGLTPLHVAATSIGFEDVLDTLLEDPGKVGIAAWKTAQDSNGLTPYDYASLRGHSAYINLFEQKIRTQNKKSLPPLCDDVVLDIPSNLIVKQPVDSAKSTYSVSSFRTEKTTTTTSKVAPLPCSLCERRSNLDYGYVGTAFTYRPAMLSLLAVAAVCVCVALLFKSSPEVYVFRPFRWETLKYGAM